MNFGRNFIGIHGNEKNKRAKDQETLKEIQYAEEAPFESVFFDIEAPIYLMCFPEYVSSHVPNNAWMENRPEDDKEFDIDYAWSQWMNVYGVLSEMGMVYLLPPKRNLQDLVYTANLGIVLPGHVSKNTVIISNFRTTPRIGESDVGRQFFSMFNFNIFTAPHFWEGEAELKFLKDNVFIGGHGIRSSLDTYSWMSTTFDMKIIPITLTNEYLYHVDTNIFPLNNDNLIVSDLVAKEEKKELEKYATLHIVDEKESLFGTCNSVRAGNLILNGSPLLEMEEDEEDYEVEKNRVEHLTKICASCGYEPYFIDISEFEKSGAALSCLVMHLNYFDYLNGDKYFSSRYDTRKETIKEVLKVNE